MEHSFRFSLKKMLSWVSGTFGSFFAIFFFHVRTYRAKVGLLLFRSKTKKPFFGWGVTPRGQTPPLFFLG